MAMSTTIIHGDCLEELKKLEDNSVDAVVTDPPYGLSNTKPAQVADVLKAWVTGDTKVVPAGKGFMNAAWDSFVPPPAVWEECMRVLKPGGHMAVFAGARTQDLMGLSIRLAGFEIRDTLGWIYGSGMPKSMDISKAIDRSNGENRNRQLEFTEWMRSTGITATQINEATGTNMGGHYLTAASQPAIATADLFDKLRPLLPEVPERIERLVAERTGIEWTDYIKREITQHATRELVQGDAISFDQRSSKERERRDIPSSDAAKQWDGWGTNLKPAIEPILLCRKPLDGTVASNVLAHGVGGLNIDACRVATDEAIPSHHGTSGAAGVTMGKYRDYVPGSATAASASNVQTAGRFPANVLLDEHAAKEMDKQSGPAGAHGESRGGGTRGMLGWQSDNRQTANVGSGGASRFFPVFKSEEETPETKGRFPANVLLDEHAAAEMDEQSGIVPSGGRTSARNAPKFSNGVYGQWSGAEEKTYAPDTGGASRYFPVFKYQAKAPKKERPVIEREDGTKIQHATVKPLALMEWLVSLIVPPGGVVLDPFAGSGTTLQAALNKGFQPIGIEQDADYIKLIEQRLAA